MPPGVFRNKNKVIRAYERIFSDVETYRNLGKTADRSIRFGETEIQTRDYQLEAWAAVGRARAEGKDSALIHLATGLGKTTVGVVDSLDFAADFYQENGRPPKIMFAVHQKEILDQAAERYQEFAPSLSQGYHADGKTDTESAVTFATMQSLYQNLGKIDPNEFDYIIYDEAHHAQAETYSAVIEHFTPRFKLALTATPDRMDDKDIRDLFGEAVYSKPLAEAMAEGYLADVDYHIVFDEAVKRAMEAGFTPDTLNEIRELLKNESRNEEIAEQIQQEMERIGLAHAKTIVFCQDVSQASEMAALLGGMPYHSGVHPDDRDETLKGFRSNGIQVITTRDMFNEGVDIPDARLLVFLRSTSSRTIFEQQLGRGLRRHAGKDTVSVLDFVANVERLSQVKELSDDIAAAASSEGDGNQDSETTCITRDTNRGLSIHTGHTDFDFERMTVELLEKISIIRERQNRYVPQTMEEAALLWRTNFGDERPQYPTINRASKEGTFVSLNTINRLGGLGSLQTVLGFDPRPTLSTIEDAATLWRELFGNEEPTAEKIREASKSKLFVSRNTIRELGGVNALKQALGFVVKENSKLGIIETIEDAAVLWREKFGDDIPTQRKIRSASSNGEFVSYHVISSFGGVEALKEALGLEVRLKVETIEDAAALWYQHFGDEVPSASKIKRASKSQTFISYDQVTELGGIDALKETLGHTENAPVTVETIEEAAMLWREHFGDEVPSARAIKLASRNNVFISYDKLSKNFGGLDALKQALANLS